MPAGVVLPAVLTLPLSKTSLPVAPPFRPAMIAPAPPVALKAAVGLLSVTTPAAELPMMNEPLSVSVQLLLMTSPPTPLVEFPMLTEGLPLAVKVFAEVEFNKIVPKPAEVPLKNEAEPPP